MFPNLSQTPRIIQTPTASSLEGAEIKLQEAGQSRAAETKWKAVEEAEAREEEESMRGKCKKLWQKLVEREVETLVDLKRRSTRCS